MSKTPIPKQPSSNAREFDLEERTFLFSSRVRIFTKSLPRTVENIEDIRQLTRSSGSVGSNYIEANEALSRKDFVYRIKVCRKEAKESRYFIRLVDVGDDPIREKEREELIQEATELLKIFNAIAEKSENKR